MSFYLHYLHFSEKYVNWMNPSDFLFTTVDILLQPKEFVTVKYFKPVFYVIYVTNSFVYSQRANPLKCFQHNK